MKRLFLIMMGMIFTFQLQAQDDAISKFFSKYVEDDAFTVVNVSSKMFSLFAEIDPEDPEDKETMEAISKLDGLKILALEDSEKAAGVYKEAKSLIPEKDYEELMSVRTEDMNLRFLIKDQSGKISELLMLGGGEEDFFLMSLVGDIDLNQISKMSGKMAIDGFENFRHLDKEKKETKEEEEMRKG